MNITAISTFTGNIFQACKQRYDSRLKAFIAWGTRTLATGFFFSNSASSRDALSKCVFILACNAGYRAVKAGVLTCTPHGMSTPAAQAAGSRRSVSISCNYRTNRAKLKGVNHLRMAGPSEVCCPRVEANLPWSWFREQISICYWGH